MASGANVTVGMNSTEKKLFVALIDYDETSKKRDRVSTTKYFKQLLNSNQVNINVVNELGFTLLHHFVYLVRLGGEAFRSKIGALDLILEKDGLNLDFQNKKGNTALMEAIATCNDEDIDIIVKKLIEKGADMKIQNLEGDTYLHLLCQRSSLSDSVEFISFCIEKWNSSTVRNRDGYTPLMLAVLGGWTNYNILVMLTPDSIRNDVFKDGETVLHKTCRNLPETEDLLDYVKFLVTQRNASIQHQSKSGDTPLHVLLESWKDRTNFHKMRDALQLLTSEAVLRLKNSNSSTPLHLACDKLGFRKMAECIVFLLDTTKLDISKDDLSYWEDAAKKTPIHLVIEGGEIDVYTLFPVFEKLLPTKDYIRKYSYILLSTAYENGNVNAMLYLLFNGADKTQFPTPELRFRDIVDIESSSDMFNEIDVYTVLMMFGMINRTNLDERLGELGKLIKDQALQSKKEVKTSALNFFRLLLIAGANPNTKIATGKKIVSLTNYLETDLSVSDDASVGALKLLIDYGATDYDPKASIWSTDVGKWILGSRPTRKLPSSQQLATVALQNPEFTNPYTKQKMNAYLASPVPTVEQKDGINTVKDWIMNFGNKYLMMSVRTALKLQENRDHDESSAASSSQSSASLQIRSFLIACKKGDANRVSALLKETPSLTKVITGTGKTVPQYIVHVGQDHLLSLIK